MSARKAITKSLSSLIDEMSKSTYRKQIAQSTYWRIEDDVWGSFVVQDRFIPLIVGARLTQANGD